MTQQLSCQDLKATLDPLTLLDIANATGKDLCDPENNNVYQALLQPINQHVELAKLMLDFIETLPHAYLVNAEPKKVEAIKKIVKKKIANGEGLSPTQLLVIRMMLPATSFTGYETIDPKGVKLPKDHKFHLQATNDWWFVVGRMLSDQGIMVAPEIQFFITNVFPKPFLDKHKLDPLQFMYMELHFAMSVNLPGPDNKLQKVYISNTSTLIPGSFGMVAINQKTENGDLVLATVGGRSSLTILANGNVNVVLNDKDSNGNPMSITLALKDNKGVYYQSNDIGCAPCISGIGSLYYSYSNLSLIAGNAKFSVDSKGYDINFSQGKFWIDHQWSHGTLPASGYVQSWLLRALGNLSTQKELTGWNWFQVQLNDNTELTGAYFFDRVFSTNPGTVTTELEKAFTMITQDGKRYVYPKTTVTLTDWIPLVQPSLETYFYPTTAVIDFKTNEKNTPVLTLRSDVDLPVHYFRTGSIYREGPVTVFNPSGQVVGYGFLELVSNEPSKNRNKVRAALLGITEQEVEEASISATPSRRLKLASVLYFILILLVIVLIFSLIKRAWKRRKVVS